MIHEGVKDVSGGPIHAAHDDGTKDSLVLVVVKALKRDDSQLVVVAVEAVPGIEALAGREGPAVFRSYLRSAGSWPLS